MEGVAKKGKVKFTREELKKKGLPVALITSILLLSSLGINKLSDLKKVNDFQTWVVAHPVSGKVKNVIDGDTFEISGGDRMVRLLGINAPDRGETGYEESKASLKKLIEGKTIQLEYDRYQDDQFNRLLAWVWVGCESKAEFLPFDYMRLTYNRSREGLKDNPVGCKKGKLLNEEMMKNDLTRFEVFKERGELKYEKKLSAIGRDIP